MNTNEMLAALPEPDMTACPYANSRHRGAWANGHRHFRLPTNHPLRGVQDYTVSRGERLAFVKGWAMARDENGGSAERVSSLMFHNGWTREHAETYVAARERAESNMTEAQTRLLASMRYATEHGNGD